MLLDLQLFVLESVMRHLKVHEGATLLQQGCLDDRIKSRVIIDQRPSMPIANIVMLLSRLMQASDIRNECNA